MSSVQPPIDPVVAKLRFYDNPLGLIDALFLLFVGGLLGCLLCISDGIAKSNSAAFVLLTLGTGSFIIAGFGCIIAWLRGRMLPLALEFLPIIGIAAYFAANWLTLNFLSALWHGLLFVVSLSRVIFHAIGRWRRWGELDDEKIKRWSHGQGRAP